VDFYKQLVLQQKAHVLARSTRSVKITGKLPLEQTWTLTLSPLIDVDSNGLASFKTYDQPTVSWIETSPELFDNDGSWRYVSLYDLDTGLGYNEWETEVNFDTKEVRFTLNPNCDYYPECKAYTDFFRPSTNLVLGAWLYDNPSDEYMTIVMLTPIKIVRGPTVVQLNSPSSSVDFRANIPVTIRRGTHEVVEEIKIVRIDNVAEYAIKDFTVNENVYEQKDVTLLGSDIGAGSPHSILYGEESFPFFTNTSGATLSLSPPSPLRHPDDKLVVTFDLGAELTATKWDFITIVKKGDEYGLPGEIWAYTSTGTQTVAETDVA